MGFSNVIHSSKHLAGDFLLSIHKMNFLLASFLLIVLTLVILKIYKIKTFGRYTIIRSLKGKVILITGGTAGIGKETVLELAKNGATVHVLARNMKKAEEVIGEIKESTGTDDDIHIHQVDLSDFSTVRSFAKKFLATTSPIHILINNAGLINPYKKYTIDGNEETIQANHLSHFLLTNLLLDRILQSSPSRIINVSSLGHTWSNENFDVYDINYKKGNRWTGEVAYRHSKLMNVLFTRELARQLYGKGVTVNALHPGVIATEIGRNLTWKQAIAMVTSALHLLLLFKTQREGAATTLYLADSKTVEHVNGQYFADCKLDTMSLLAVNDQLASELWRESEKLVYH